MHPFDSVELLYFTNFSILSRRDIAGFIPHFHINILLCYILASKNFQFLKTLAFHRFSMVTNFFILTIVHCKHLTILNSINLSLRLFRY